MNRRSLLRNVGPFAITGGLLTAGSATAQEGDPNEISTAVADEIYLDSSATADTVPSVTEDSALYLRSLDQNGGYTDTLDGNDSSTNIVDQDPAEVGLSGFSLGAFSESRVVDTEYATAVAWVEWETDIEEPTTFEIHAEYDYITVAGSGSVSPFAENDDDDETSEWENKQTTTEENDQDTANDVQPQVGQVAVPVISGLVGGSGSDAAYSLSLVLQKLDVSTTSAAIVEEVEVTSGTADSEEHEEDEVTIITESLDTDSQYRLVCIAHTESSAIGLAGGGAYVTSYGEDGYLPGWWINQIEVTPQGYEPDPPDCPPGEVCPVSEEE